MFRETLIRSEVEEPGPRKFCGDRGKLLEVTNAAAASSAASQYAAAVHSGNGIELRDLCPDLSPNSALPEIPGGFLTGGGEPMRALRELIGRPHRVF